MNRLAGKIFNSLTKQNVSPEKAKIISEILGGDKYCSCENIDLYYEYEDEIRDYLYYYKGYYVLGNGKYLIIKDSGGFYLSGIFYCNGHKKHDEIYLDDGYYVDMDDLIIVGGNSVLIELAWQFISFEKTYSYLKYIE